MPAITRARFQAAYQFAKAVRKGELTEREAIDRLDYELGMDRGSASGYLRQLENFLAGKTYTRTINDADTRYYLEQIEVDFGTTGLHQGLIALAAHIEYYEAAASARPSLRAILAELQTRLPSSQKAITTEFEKNVDASLVLQKSVREKLLPPAGYKPAAITVTTTAYIRNPHVAAAARERAGGRCERCKKPAPFKRKSNQSPFLEVHHIVTLANGDDTLENVLALCPNCHRELHFG